MLHNPRGEYPRPQLMRNCWQSLNGAWRFTFDNSDAGLKNGFHISPSFEKEINVPFCYQCGISGVEDKRSYEIMWYHKEFEIPKHMEGKNIILHFGAVDYSAKVFLNGQMVAEHEGGHTPFSCDITPFLRDGAQNLVVRVFDPIFAEDIPRGKQFWKQEPEGIWYTRTSGIWQSVWIEAVNEIYIKNLRFTPDIDNGNIHIEMDVEGMDVKAEEVCAKFDISFKGQPVAGITTNIFDTKTSLCLNLFGQNVFRTSFHHDGWCWTPENPNLFDIEVALLSKRQETDRVSSYFGMRKVHTKDGKFFLNNRPYYQRLVLDQGYWPGSLMTAQKDEDFVKDIELAKNMGFNGARKHQKVEDPRYLYHADKMGFLVWGECANAVSYSGKAAGRLMCEWLEIIERDYNHPCIVCWVPMNESWGVPNLTTSPEQRAHLNALYHTIKSLDQSRPVISNDGWEMTVTDIVAIHSYSHGGSQDNKQHAVFQESLTPENILLGSHAARPIFLEGYQHENQPIVLTEFGGIAYKADSASGWGYSMVKDEAELLSDLERVVSTVKASKAIHGYCYTQLTDVEQEINGLLTYDRKPKADLEKIKSIFN